MSFDVLLPYTAQAEISGSSHTGTHPMERTVSVFKRSLAAEPASRLLQALRAGKRDEKIHKARMVTDRSQDIESAAPSVGRYGKEDNILADLRSLP